ncbi:MAG: response regulator [Candidatus Freyarchaeota archaeon]|nr:response regulator [Candidatus Jordarchaeia archaeon]MBS7268598.1 response regulator [Candidatus Jordarchaeia archaeon]MBS7279287.1 response regulator [Candidatus Jordarchaeia archaeon]
MSESARILIVDDDESIRKVLTAILQEEGYIVDTARSGKEAIEKTENNFYNLALVDIRLPDIEGTKLLSMMKETVPKMAKIIITGYPSMQNAIEAVNRNADRYLLKPLNMEELLKAVRELLKKQQEERKYSEEKVLEFIQSRIRELGKSSK